MIRIKTKDCLKCQNPSYAKGLCRYHYTIDHQDRVRAKRAETQEAKKTYSKTIPKLSGKMITKKAIYLKQRNTFMLQTENRYCKVKGCGKFATDVHHMKGRIGNDLLDEKNWIAVCRECHNRIEENPAWAKENGYSVSRLEVYDEKKERFEKALLVAIYVSHETLLFELNNYHLIAIARVLSHIPKDAMSDEEFYQEVEDATIEVIDRLKKLEIKYGIY